jgi:ubiquinone/menaquinone biosynthesis C-methylase UbiE
MQPMGAQVVDIDTMPRGGPDASRLDRLLQTDTPEYLDRDDVDHLKRKVVRGLERMGSLARHHKKCARMALDEVADVPDPKILELGSGHGALSRKLLQMHPTAEVTVTDIEPTSVAEIAAGDLGDHARATVRTMDATAIDAPDRHFDLAVFALSLHHLPPRAAARVFAEGTRAANKLLIIDMARPPAPFHIIRLAAFLPFAAVMPLAHDGFISSLRSYSRSALCALAEYADPTIAVECRGGFPRFQVVVAARTE